MNLVAYVAAPPKSGTLTIHRALTESGIDSVHGRGDKGTEHVAVALWRSFVEDRGHLLRYLPTEAVTDHALTPSGGAGALWPMLSPVFLKTLSLWHPGTLVLLPTRDPDAWVESVSRWKDLRDRIVAADLPYLPEGRGARDGELRAFYSDHLDRVRESFRAHRRFLEFELSDPEAPKLIGVALGRPLRWWGTENANPR